MTCAGRTDPEKPGDALVVADYWKLIECHNRSALVHSAAGDIVRIADRLSRWLLQETVSAEVMKRDVKPAVTEEACKDILVILDMAKGILGRSEETRAALEGETIEGARHRGLVAAV